MNRRAGALLLLSSIVLSIAIPSCTAPKIVDEWSAAPATPNAYRTIMVVRIAKDPEVRKTSEDAFVAALAKVGVTARPSYEYLTYGTNVSATTLRDAVARAGADAALVVRSLYAEERVDVTPGYYQPSMGTAFYEDFPSAWGADIYEPPSIERYEVYTFETTLFDVRTNKLVWSAMTQSEDTAATPNEAASYARTIVSALRDRGML